MTTTRVAAAAATTPGTAAAATITPPPCPPITTDTAPITITALLFHGGCCYYYHGCSWDRGCRYYRSLLLPGPLLLLLLLSPLLLLLFLLLPSRLLRNCYCYCFGRGSCSLPPALLPLSSRIYGTSKEGAWLVLYILAYLTFFQISKVVINI